jgi:hypothetical protein
MIVDRPGRGSSDRPPKVRWCESTISLRSGSNSRLEPNTRPIWLHGLDPALGADQLLLEVQKLALELFDPLGQAL